MKHLSAIKSIFIEHLCLMMGFIAKLKTRRYYIPQNFLLVKTSKHFETRSSRLRHLLIRAQGWTLMRTNPVSKGRRRRKMARTQHLKKSRGKMENFLQTIMWRGNCPVTAAILHQAEIRIFWDLKLCYANPQAFIMLKVVNQNIKFSVYPGCIRIKSRILPKLRLGRR